MCISACFVRFSATKELNQAEMLAGWGKTHSTYSRSVCPSRCFSHHSYSKAKNRQIGVPAAGQWWWCRVVGIGPGSIVQLVAACERFGGGEQNIACATPRQNRSLGRALRLGTETACLGPSEKCTSALAFRDLRSER
jgi:hypothetical protein